LSVFPCPPDLTRLQAPPEPFPCHLRPSRWREASAIALRPSNVLGPVLKPPWLLHRPFGNALALQGSPVLRAWAPHQGRWDCPRQLARAVIYLLGADLCGSWPQFKGADGANVIQIPPSFFTMPPKLPRSDAR
jgi:hypothetical protein